MIEFIKTKTPIQICDIGASSKDKTKFFSIYNEYLNDYLDFIIS